MQTTSDYGTMQSKPNILLIIMDSVRAKNTSLHDHVNNTTPFLSRFEEESTKYEQARAPGVATIPSHTSIFTGTHVDQHQITGPGDQLSEGNTIFEELSNAGYKTGVFSPNAFLTNREVGLQHAFDTVHGAGQEYPFPEANSPDTISLSPGAKKYIEYFKFSLNSNQPIKTLLNGGAKFGSLFHSDVIPKQFQADLSAEKFANAFLSWEKDLTGPWAACVNFMDAHLPLLPSDEHNLWGDSTLKKLQQDETSANYDFHAGNRPWWQCEAFEALYDGTIHQIDEQIGKIIDDLRQREELDETLVVVTSDHGEGFGEKSNIRPNARVTGHGVGIHECLLHVPLIVNFPGQNSGSTVSAPASLTNFPKLVNSVLKDTHSHDELVPDDRVIASSYGLSEVGKDQARNYIDDISEFTGHFRAVYDDREDKDGITKYVSWKDSSITLQVVNAHSSYISSRGEAKDIVLNAYGNMSKEELQEGSLYMGEIDEATKNRLEKLGYM